MKATLFFTILSLIALLAGCDIKTGDDAKDFDGYYNSGYVDSSYYDPVYGGYVQEQHILIGNLEVVDSNSRMPLQGVQIEGWIYDDGILRESFVVRTTNLGIARIETAFQDSRRPFTHLEIRILEPGFRPLSTSISIRRIDRLIDDRGTPTTVYEASDIFYLPPPLNSTRRTTLGYYIDIEPRNPGHLTLKELDQRFLNADCPPSSAREGDTVPEDKREVYEHESWIDLGTLNLYTCKETHPIGHIRVSWSRHPEDFRKPLEL